MSATEPDASLRILAVDDDTLILMNTVALLEDLGHAVVEASSGQEALQKLESDGAFDLLITDHAMPQMTGGELIAQVSSRWPDIPIILASGYAEIPGAVVACAERLAKPFWQADLQRAIANATSARLPGAPAESHRQRKFSARERI